MIFDSIDLDMRYSEQKTDISAGKTARYAPLEKLADYYIINVLHITLLLLGPFEPAPDVRGKRQQL